MPKYTTREFADLCKIPFHYIKVYKGRGKIIVVDKKIDTDNIINQEFLEKYTGDMPEVVVPKKSTGAAPVKLPAKEKPVEKKAEAPKSKIHHPDESTLNTPSKRLYEWDVKLKQAELEKKTVDTRLQALKEKKLIGELIPTSLVENVFSMHTKTIIIEFSNSVDNIVTILSKKYGVGIKEVAEVRKQIIDEINLAANRSVDTSKRDIKLIVKEYSLAKGVGERN